MGSERAGEPWVLRLASTPTSWDMWGKHSASLCLGLFIYKPGMTVPFSQVFVRIKIPQEKCAAQCWPMVGTQVSTQ